MPTSKRAQHPHTEDWSQITQLCLWPEQRRYELLRPVVLYGDTPAERAAQTGANERTLRRQADQFEAEGLLSFFRPSQQQVADHHRSLPPPLRQLIVDLKAEYPAFSLRELAQICFVQFGRRPSQPTIKHVLADGPTPSRTGRRFPRYSEMEDPFERRRAVITLHLEGWTPASIADYLGLSRSTTYDLLKRFQAEGFVGIAPKSSANTRPVRKVDVTIKQAILTLQENPELGAWRMHAALKQLGWHISPTTCGRIMAENRQLYGLGKPPKEQKAPKEHPYKGLYRHHVWSVDVRYIEQHQIAGLSRPFYIISVLDNFSRAILASNVCQRQDELAYLRILSEAILRHGSPDLLVSDSGGIFVSKQAKFIYAKLGIQKEQIHKKQAWENLIETNFNLQRRLTDFYFAQVTSWEGAKLEHERWMQTHNEQAHWAHRQREDGKRTPAEVLDHAVLHAWSPEYLHRVFFTRRFGRWVDRLGYVRFRQWHLYGEAGLARQAATLWLYGKTLTVEFASTPLTQFSVSFQPDQKRFRSVKLQQRFETPYRSPQLSLWSEDEVKWLLAWKARDVERRKAVRSTPVLVMQPSLFADPEVS